MIRRQSWKADFKDLVEMWISPENRKLTIAWAVCALGVILMGIQTSSYSTSFLGIAESRESIINFEFPVLVKRIHVLPGQQVNKGELLAELDQPDLDSKIRSTRSQLEKLQAERSLKHEMGRLAANTMHQREDGGDVFDPLSSDIKNLELELKILEGRERNLYVFSEISGVVGSVNFKRGERAAPYATILTVSPSSPTRVQGFIHESLHSQIKLGQRMTVSSVSDPSKKIDGQIVSIGSRIVELPMRMARANVPVWGREVQVELPSGPNVMNPFLLGEKVQIQPPAFAWIGFSSAIAAETKAEKPGTAQPMPAAANVEPEVIELPESVKARSKFEPSGIVYLQDLRKYAVISDDTDDEDTPYVFLLNTDGTLDTSVLQVNGLPKISDVESISSENDKEFYMVSSMTKNSKGNKKKGRTLLSRVRREGTLLTAVKTISLRESLMDALESSPLPALRELHDQFDDELEIEATMIRGGKLIAALKHPLDAQGRSLVLDLGSISDIMTTGKVRAKDVSIWKTIAFPLFGSKSVHITDIVQLDDSRVAVSTMSKGHGKTGRVWIIDFSKSDEPALLAAYPGYTPEGLAYEPKSQELMIVFDEGSDDARFSKMKIPAKQ